MKDLLGNYDRGEALNLVPINKLSQIWASLSAVFILASHFLAWKVTLSLDSVVVGLLVVLSLLMIEHSKVRTAFAILALCMAFVSAGSPIVNVLFVDNAEHMNMTLLFAFLAGTILLEPSSRFSAVVCLSVAFCMTLIVMLSFSFGLSFLGHAVDASAAMACLLLSGATLTSLANRGWLKLLFEASFSGMRVRVIVTLSVLVPWTIGMLLYHIFGVTERHIPVEAAIIAVVIVGLIATTVFVSRILEQQERKRAELFSSLVNQVMTDDLTGLRNRAGSRTYLEDAWTKFQETDQDVVVVLFDLDHFKQINDQFGHDGGDLVLKAVGGALGPHLRSGDMVGRWGGEEFLCVLVDANISQLENIGERLRRAIAAISPQMSVLLGGPCKISASFGITRMLPEDANYAEAISRADKALYDSKKEGRNRVSYRADISLVSSSPEVA